MGNSCRRLAQARIGLIAVAGVLAMSAAVYIGEKKRMTFLCSGSVPYAIPLPWRHRSAYGN